MKKIILLASLLIICSTAQNQILKKMAEKAKQKAEEKANEKMDKKTDPPADENKDAGDKNNADTTIKDPNTPGSSASIKAYSKYDFVPGEKVIGFEDFSTGSIGDFPAGWNTNGADTSG